MNKTKCVNLTFLLMFAIGYGYGIIDTLTGFDITQVGITCIVFAICLLAILFGKSEKDAKVSGEEQDG